MRLAFFALCAAASPAIAQFTFTVSPNSRTSTEGNQAAAVPFATDSVTRYQQVFGAGSLSSLVGKQITQIAFRLDGGATGDYPGGFTYTGLVVKLSTTSATVDGLSATMDNNVGADVQTVYSGSYTLPTLHASATPRPFDFVINFQMPFLYSGGNLLLDVTGLSNPGTAFNLDAEMTAGDSVSRIFQPTTGAPTADTLGLVTRFTGRSTMCYANCDGSTAAPVLNVNDFICFQWQFAVGTSYANCDGSTAPPVLNVNDFVCFQTRFAAGCQ